MISSEVQRTLVKSPPELWAELSDPGSLARHLGDLGEIRITRVEPEQLVEWEAENRTGKVQIKPSGWGTRVTLTVASEIPETATSLAPAQPESAADPGAGDPEQAEAEPTPGLEEPPTAQTEESDPPIDPARPEEPDPTSEMQVGAAWPAETEPVFAPATPAALAWRKQAGPPEPQDGGEIELPGPETQPVHAEPYRWLAEDELQPRRGFFARLFGRRQTPRSLEPDPYDEPYEAIAAIGSSEPAAELALDGLEQQASEDAGEPQDMPTVESPEPASQAPEPASQAPEPASQAPEPASRAPEPASQASEQASQASVAATEQAPEPASQAPEPASQAPEPASQAPVAATEQAPETHDGGEAPSEQGGERLQQPQAPEAPEDISAELKAAEEIAAAEVTAVLTSVLDRLGAAHHRPFSRS
ncbi:MAG TPA: hypothetical protein VNZ01_05615 [Solirubrobacteraceae bacterium]|jgi:hypothetical protein|nr:hypothetical protein [Solirubrobacteraceae bacterium]